MAPRLGSGKFIARPSTLATGGGRNKYERNRIINPTLSGAIWEEGQELKLATASSSKGRRLGGDDGCAGVALVPPAGRPCAGLDCPPSPCQSHRHPATEPCVLPEAASDAAFSQRFGAVEMVEEQVSAPRSAPAKASDAEVATGDHATPEPLQQLVYYHRRTRRVAWDPQRQDDRRLVLAGGRVARDFQYRPPQARTGAATR